MIGDWIGVAFFVLILVGAFVGLRALSKPRPRTAEEFERNAAEGTTAIGASMNALQELMNPEAAKAKEVITQMKEGRYQKKKREGKANAAEDDEEEPRSGEGE
ncbi:MAG TPA: hypothetical protein VJV05_02450 [Pyrinomonadaceae bacterium]|nr:hypothetical protein [Pyrinomonadaceae bacterium]